MLNATVDYTAFVKHRMYYKLGACLNTALAQQQQPQQPSPNSLNAINPADGKSTSGLPTSTTGKAPSSNKGWRGGRSSKGGSGTEERGFGGGGCRTDFFSDQNDNDNNPLDKTVLQYGTGYLLTRRTSLDLAETYSPLGGAGDPSLALNLNVPISDHNRITASAGWTFPASAESKRESKITTLSDSLGLDIRHGHLIFIRTRHAP